MSFSIGAVSQTRDSGDSSDAKAPSHPPHAIQDNSFLVEEAYNQEAGVVQHINQYTRFRGTGDWIFTLTEEWPASGIHHQLSYAVAAAGAGDAGSGAGDVALNYRYQLIGDDEAVVAIAPRLTVFFPTGSSRRGLGAGAVGYQVGLPVSTVLSTEWVTHWNAGATWTPSARNQMGQRADTLGWNVGASFIWTGSPVCDVMLESVYSKSQTPTAPGKTSSQETFFVSPGVRWVYDFDSGLQIVPGIAVPLGVGPSAGRRQILLYLSFEHPFRRSKPLPGS